MVSDYEAYKLYTAVKLHFTTDSYDVFKYKGRVNCPVNKFQARNDRFLFAKLGEKFSNPKELIEYYVANFAYGHNNLIYDRELADDNHKIWLKRKETMNYEFSKQMTLLYNYMDRQHILSYSDLFNTDGGAPLLLQLYMSKHIHLETLVIINEFENFLPDWDCLILIWKDQLNLLSKVKRFVRYDKDRLQLTYTKHKAEIYEMYHGTHH